MRSCACAGLLILLVGRAVWRNGLRVWLGSLGEAMGHDHAHGHAHGHDHAASQKAHAPSPLPDVI